MLKGENQMADDELLGRIPRDAKNEFKVTRGRYWNTDYVAVSYTHLRAHET